MADPGDRESGLRYNLNRLREGEPVEVRWSDPKNWYGWHALDTIREWAAGDDDQRSLGYFLLLTDEYVVIAPGHSGPDHAGPVVYSDPFKIPLTSLRSIHPVPDFG